MSKSSSAAWCPVMRASWPPGRRHGNQPRPETRPGIREAVALSCSHARRFLRRHRPYPGRPLPRPASRRSRARSSRSGRPRAPSERSVEPRPPATTSSSSTTARPSPTGCPTTATSSPASSRTSSPATRPCGAGGSSAASAGTATACPPRWRPRRSSASRAAARSPSTASTASTTTAGPRCCATPTEWERYVTRQARWVDFANDYKTMDLSYMESVMWAFKQLWDKGLLYEGYRVLPYCWECETPLSNFETRLDDAYRDRQDPAVTVAFTLEPATGPAPSWWPGPCRSGPGRRRRGRCRRTWPSPSGPTSTYAVFERGRRPRFLARRGAPSAATRSSSEGADAARHGHRAATWSGRRYRPLFPFFAEHARTPSGSSAPTSSTTDEGTGVVHMAPGFGEDDQIVCARRRHRRSSARSTTGAASPPRSRLRGPAGLRRQPADHPGPARQQGVAGAPRHLRPQLPALLAHRHAARSTRP